MSRRTERIGEQIRAELARLLHEETTDPRIGFGAPRIGPTARRNDGASTERRACAGPIFRTSLEIHLATIEYRWYRSRP